MWALAKDLFFYGIDLEYVSSFDFKRLVSQQYGDDTLGGDARFRLHALRSAQILIFSDVGAENPTENNQVELYSLIDYRAQKLRPILWTTRFSKMDLAAKFTQSDAIDRLYQVSDVIEVERQSFRASAHRMPVQARSA
jgi:DNA replication protein DnaC